MTDHALALGYAPLLHLDKGETIPLVGVGYTLLRASGPSSSFRRTLSLPQGAELLIEYAYYWDYDIQHMYDLEHIWVAVDKQGEVIAAQGSFHGKYLELYQPDMPFALHPEDGHVHAFCQPGKHAFLPAGELFRLIPGWREACTTQAGGPVLVGGPFQGAYASTPRQDALCREYIRQTFAFSPTLDFIPSDPAQPRYMPWEELRAWIPQRITAECARLEALFPNASL